MSDKREWGVYAEDGRRMGYVYADTIEEAMQEAEKRFPGWDDIDAE